MPEDEYSVVGEHSVRKVHPYGLSVTLDDGSVWDIQPGPSTRVCLWYEQQRIQVESNGTQFRLTNLYTSGPDTVPARRRTRRRKK